MNKVVFAFALIASSFAFANGELNASATQLCVTIAGISSSSALECSKIISQGRITDTAAHFCSQVANSSISQSLQCLTSSLNQKYDMHASELCLQIANISASYGVTCHETIANKQYGGVLAICSKLAESNIANAITCLKDSGTKMIDSQEQAQTGAHATCPAPAEVLKAVKLVRNSLSVGGVFQAGRLLKDIESALAKCP